MKLEMKETLATETTKKHLSKTSFENRIINWADHFYLIVSGLKHHK